MIALQPIANHLCQSTVFAAAVGFMTLFLRRNRAQVRHALWLAASVKFLIPLSLLIAMGTHLAPHAPPAALTQSGFSMVMTRVSEPVHVPAPPITLEASPTNAIPAVLFTIWIIGFVILVSSWRLRWQRVRASLAAASRTHLPFNSQIDLEVVTSADFAEPGIFGIWNPVLLLPAGIADRLTPSQLKAVLAHELYHVRRRDNLTSAIHMSVEALFWFHPLVWWLGARLIDERERACDEAVLLSSEPQVYAEGILRVCELYLESPLPCVAGVTGGNLKKRIEAVMSNRAVLNLNPAKKAALLIAAVTALALPVIIGVVNAPVLSAQSNEAFAAASVKAIPDSVGWPPRRGYFLPPRMESADRFRSLMQLSQVIAWAYDVRDFQILEAPAWTNEGRFEIQATAGQPTTEGQMRQMVQALLADRFRLRLHRETRDIPVYALVVGKNGPKLTAAKDLSVNDARGSIEVGGTGEVIAQAAPMADFVRILTDNLDRPAVDRTNLTGRYDFTLHYDQSSLPDWRLGPALFSLVQDVGLKLESQKAPFEMLVIDSVERPSQN